MSNEDSSLLKISIKRESSKETGREKFTMVSEDFLMTDPAESPPTTTEFAYGQYVKCAVPRCYNYFDGHRQEFIGISYFPFPDEPDLRKQWIKTIDLPNDTDTSLLKICSKHFGNNDIYDMQEVDGKTTTHLKPNAYPCKRLYAFVHNHNKQTHSFDEAGKFIGLENSIIDTSQDASTSKEGSGLKITSVLSMDAGGKMVDAAVNEHSRACDSPGHSSAKPKMYTHHKKPTAVKQVEDMGSHADELICEETASSDDTDSQTPVTNPEKGLQVIPALVKLPPRLPKIDLVGDSVNVEGDSSGGPITTSRLPNVDLADEMNRANDNESVLEYTREEPSTSSIPVNQSPEVEHSPIKRRRGRRSKEEMRRREEDDEWEPSFWGRRALQKDGFASHLDADKKRKEKETRYRTPRSIDCAPLVNQSTDVQKNQDDGLEEEDEGWRVVEPIATGYGENKSDEEAEDGSDIPLALLEVSMADGESEGNKSIPSAGKRRPGPASKTCRPRYIPQSKETETAEEQTGKNDGADEKEENQHDPKSGDLYHSSLLVEWSFFKSLLPDLGKLSDEKRIELKSFVLDTLNSAIYDGKPITPIMNL